MFASQNHIKNQVKHLLNVFSKSEAVIRPHFFLTGPSGSGKTYIVSALCEELDIPMFEINAAQLTAEGIREIIKEQSKKLGIGIRMLNSATHQYFMKDIK